MPSGPKKRKAAKKKKEQEASHNQNYNQQSHSAVTTHEHDDKESETEEINSPASQEHPNHQHQFTDGEKEDVEKTEHSSQVKLSSEERKTIDEHKDDDAAVEKAVVEDSVVQLESEFKPAGELNNKNIIAEHVESQKESGAEVILQSVDDKSVVENEREEKLSEELDRKNVSFENVEPQKETSDGVLPQSHNDESHLVVETNVVVHISPFASCTANSLSEGLTQVPTHVQVDEVYGSAMESVSDIATDNGGLAGGKVEPDSSIPGDIFSTSNVVISGIEENGKNEEGVLDQNDGISPILVDLGLLDNKRDEAIVLSNDALRTPDAKNIVTQETEEKLMLSYSPPREEAVKCGNASNGADHIKDSQVHESSDSQPLVASATVSVQRTSWMSCCGLFEVLAGSSR